MNSEMDISQHHVLTQRALELGRSRDPACVPELIRLLGTPSAGIRRLAASALAKLADFGADAALCVAALAPVALRDPHPQTRQYALRALKCYGAEARDYLPDLDDLAANGTVKDYVRKAADSAATGIREAIRLQQEDAVHKCTRCGREVSPEEHGRSQQAFQRAFCDACFDEVFLERRNFDTKVELNKTIIAKAGALVQSDGERLIADCLPVRRAFPHPQWACDPARLLPAGAGRLCRVLGHGHRRLQDWHAEKAAALSARRQATDLHSPCGHAPAR